VTRQEVKDTKVVDPLKKIDFRMFLDVEILMGPGGAAALAV
jgi:hypothetical protein